MIIAKLYARVGRSSRIAGVGFAVLSIALLILSVYREFIVFEVDSIIAFLAAIVLLFTDPRARVQPRVLDAMLLSSNQVIDELSTHEGMGFTYEPAGNNVEDVVVVPAHFGAAGLPNGSSGSGETLTFTPPGRRLAELFRREAGLREVTMDAIRASLPEILRENFGLAKSVEIQEKGDRIEVILHGPSATCDCATIPARDDSNAGVIGCTEASFLATLVTNATKRHVILQRCVHDALADTWKVSMVLGPSIR
jgi:hypothetical protein